MWLFVDWPRSSELCNALVLGVSVPESAVHVQGICFIFFGAAIYEQSAPKMLEQRPSVDQPL